MTMVCFGRLFNARQFYCYVSQSFSQESQTIPYYENMNLVRKAKAAKI